MFSELPFGGKRSGRKTVPFLFGLLRRLNQTGLLGTSAKVSIALPFGVTDWNRDKHTHAKVGSNNTRVSDPRTGIGTLCAFTLALSLGANATRIRGECRPDEAFVRKLKMFNAPFTSGGGDGGGHGE